MTTKVIPKPDVPVLDPANGLMAKEWYDFFNPPPAPLPSPRDLRVYAQPAAGKVALLEDYGLKGDYLINGSFNASYTDNTPLWNAVMANATRGDTFILPVGPNGQGYAGFNNVPDQLPAETTLQGHGRVTSGLVRAFNPGGGSFAPFLTFDVHTTIRDLFVFSGLGTHGGFAISRVATNANDAAQDTHIENVVVSGLGALSDNDFTAALVIDSTLGAPNFGSRSINAHGCFLSRYTGWGLKVAGMNGCNFTDIDFAANTPGFTGLDLYVTGAINQHNNSCIFSGGSLDNVRAEFASACVFTTGATALIDVFSTCSGLLFLCGAVSVAPSLAAGTLSSVIANKTIYSSA